MHLAQNKRGSSFPVSVMPALQCRAKPEAWLCPLALAAAAGIAGGACSEGHLRVVYAYILESRQHMSDINP